SESLQSAVPNERFPAFASEDFLKLPSPHWNARGRARWRCGSRDPDPTERYRFHAKLRRCAELTILRSARLNTRPTRAVPRNEHEKDRAAGNAPLPPFSLRAGECSRDRETKRCPQIRLDGNVDPPAAGLTERVEHN